MQFILAEEEVEHDLADADGNTAFMLAVAHRQVEIVELLLENPFCDVNVKNIAGRTALALAVLNTDFSDTHLALIFNLLSSQRIDVNATCGVSTALSSHMWLQG